MNCWPCWIMSNLLVQVCPDQLLGLHGDGCQHHHLEISQLHEQRLAAWQLLAGTIKIIKVPWSGDVWLKICCTLLYRGEPLKRRGNFSRPVTASDFWMFLTYVWSTGRAVSCTWTSPNCWQYAVTHGFWGLACWHHWFQRQSAIFWWRAIHPWP